MHHIVIACDAQYSYNGKLVKYSYASDKVVTLNYCEMPAHHFLLYNRLMIRRADWRLIGLCTIHMIPAWGAVGVQCSVVGTEDPLQNNTLAQKKETPRLFICKFWNDRMEHRKELCPITFCELPLVVSKFAHEKARSFFFRWVYNFVEQIPGPGYLICDVMHKVVSHLETIKRDDSYSNALQEEVEHADSKPKSNQMRKQPSASTKW